MRRLLLRIQSLLLRVSGLRKLQEALDAKSDAVRADLTARLDAILAAIAARDGREQEAIARLDVLGGQLSRQGQADTERGEAVQNTLRDLQTRLEQLQDQLRRGGQSGQALAELRAEVSGMRADFAREIESTMEQLSDRKLAQG